MISSYFRVLTVVLNASEYRVIEYEVKIKSAAIVNRKNGMSYNFIGLSLLTFAMVAYKNQYHVDYFYN